MNFIRPLYAKPYFLFTIKKKVTVTRFVFFVATVAMMFYVY